MSSPRSPVPGTVVGSGSQVGPGGDQGLGGPQGVQGATGPAGPAAPIADSTQAGLLNKLSGLGTDYVGGDNACRALAAAVASALFTTWPVWTLTASSNAGAITSQSSSSTYLQIGKLVFIHFIIQIPNIGNASGNTIFSGLPVAVARQATFMMRETAINGLIYAWTVGGGATQGSVSGPTNASPTWANNLTYVGQGIYQSV